MVEVIQVVDTQFENRIGKIYQSIFSRASQYHNKNYESKYKEVLFKDLIFHKNKKFIDKFNITILPSTLFFKDNKLVFKKEGIIATKDLLQIIEEI